MATCLPRQKLFGTTTSSSFRFIFFLCVSIWAFILHSNLISPVFGEVSLDQDLIKLNQFPEDSSDTQFHNRLPREIIQIPEDGDDYEGNYNNPKVLEGAGDGRSMGGDAYETLRQLSQAATIPFIRRRLFNTSVALTVPLFSFTLPQRAAEGSTVDLANQAIFGLFALLVCMLVFTVPVLFTGIRPFDLELKRSNEESSQDILNNLMKSEHTINLMGSDMRNKIGLNPDQCLQKSICDAHRHPKKYGMFALPFQIFFPPPVPGKESGKSYSKYQMAAQTGEYIKEEECWAKYNCFFDLLDLAVYFTDWYSAKHNHNSVKENNLEGVQMNLTEFTQ